MSRAQSIPYFRSLGLELAGVKNDRTALAILDYYPKSNRLILVDIVSGFQEIDEDNPDEILKEELFGFQQGPGKITGLCIHGPTSLPPHFLGKKGIPEAAWMNRQWHDLKTHKPRPFLPYLQRACEIYMKHLSLERFEISDCLGSNAAPMAARVDFLKKSLPKPLNESFPRGILSRLVNAFGLNKNFLRLHTDFDKGNLTREDFLNRLQKKLPQIFFYARDLEKMITHIHYFNAFLLALNQHLVHSQQQEKAPRDFPKGATWIHLPKTMIDWKKVFW